VTESKQFLIDRVPAPSWETVPKDVDAMGQQGAWGVGIPWMYRALASPRTHEPVLQAPQNEDDALGPAKFSYWACLTHLMLYNLGWMRPARGLRWWYDNGKPQDDDLLRFISEVWDADGQLDWFAAMLQITDVLDEAPVTDATGYSGHREDLFPKDDPWARTLIMKMAPLQVREHIDHGMGMHFQSHIYGPLAEPRGKPLLLQSSLSERRAVLLLDSMVGWYRTLAQLGGKLAPPSGELTWRVDVVVKPVGWLGTFRRSTVTGLWYGCRHQVHLKGA
jgi:hypothetical protein